MKIQLSYIAEIGLLFLAFFLFFYNLGTTHLTNWDEAWHAVIARNISTSNNYVTPEYNGEIWFKTAPLYLWLTSIWFELFGLTEFGVRFFSALASVGTVVLTYLIGKEVKGRRVGLIAGLILTTSIQFLFRGRQGNVDTTLAFFVALAFFSYFKGLSQPKWNLGIGVATGLAFLTKSVLGLFPIMLVLLLPLQSIILSVFSFFVVVLPWHVAAYAIHQDFFIQEYLKKYVLFKTSHANPVSDSGVFWYLNVIKHGLKYWIVLLIPSLVIQITLQVKDFYGLIGQKLKSIFSHRLILLLWIAVPLILLSLMQMKNNWYIIALYPPMALMISLTIFDVLEKLEHRIKFKSDLLLSGLFLAIIVLASLNLYKYRHEYFVTDTTRAEAFLGLEAQKYSETDDLLLLDDNYLPVALWYSDREIVPLRFNRSAEALTSQAIIAEATKSGARIVLTNTETKDQLLSLWPSVSAQILAKEDDKELLKIDF